MNGRVKKLRVASVTAQPYQIVDGVHGRVIDDQHIGGAGVGHDDRCLGLLGFPLFTEKIAVLSVLLEQKPDSPLPEQKPSVLKR